MTEARPGQADLRGDESQLFERYGKRLLRVTALTVHTAPDNVDDACSFAWTELVVHQPRRETVFAWLRTVARREAIRLDRLARRVDSLEHTMEAAAIEPATSRRTIETTQSMLEVTERLAELPDRLKEVAFLRAAGWSYQEAGDRLGVSHTRINQLVTRSNLQLRELETRDIEPRSERAARLSRIEQAPPTYIVGEIGWPPRANPRHGGQDRRREWCRLALAIEDFRDARAIQDPRLAFGSDRVDRVQSGLQHRISDFNRTRERGRDISR